MKPIKKVLQAVKWFFLNPRCLFWLGMTITLLATTIEVVRGRNTNYFDYQDSTRMFWEGLTPIPWSSLRLMRSTFSTFLCSV